MSRRRVVVTGLGMLTPLGNTVDSSWQAALAGKSGIGPIEHMDVSAFGTRFGGSIRDFDIEPYMAPKEARGPIVTKVGVHVVMVEDVRAARTAPFVEKQDEIASVLYEQKRRERYREFIRKIWDRSHVDIRWR